MAKGKLSKLAEQLAPAYYRASWPNVEDDVSLCVWVRKRCGEEPPALGGIEDTCYRLSKPGSGDGLGFGGGEGLLEDARICGNSKECPECEPGKADELVP